MPKFAEVWAHYAVSRLERDRDRRSLPHSASTGLSVNIKGPPAVPEAKLCRLLPSSQSSYQTRISRAEVDFGIIRTDEQD